MSLINQTYIVSPDVLFQDVDGETVLIHLEAGEYFGLDEVGTRIWQLLTDEGDTQRILEDLRAEFDVDEDILKQDLERLLNDLLEAGLIRVQPDD